FLLIVPDAGTRILLLGGTHMGEFADKAQGEIKEKGGKLSGDKGMEWEGKGDKAKGKVEEAGRKMGQGLNEEPDPATPQGL
ncbi:MAG TPA: CsbD family protein, partial [Candidatus Sulfotelmatobacter sp.]|nr:CsbD family protein [Candidatus Sulfotelmatobacter sp.]